MSMPNEVIACRAYLVKQASLAKTDEERAEAEEAMNGFTILSASVARLFALLSRIPDEELEKAVAIVEQLEQEMAATAH